MKTLPNGIAVLENDLISSWVEQSGRLDHDQNTLPIVLPHIKPGDWVVDGGAFIGDHAIAYVRAAGDTGRVMAFEPNPAARECLERNVPTAEVFPCGLGHLVARYTYSRNDGNQGASHIQKGGSEIILALPLDALYLTRCDFIKLDLEGFEYCALLGADHTIQTYRPKMLIEINKGALARNDHNPELIYEFMDSMGYDFKPIWPTSKLDDEQLDILCLAK